jgi:acyl-coenzyme A synthetase/AMP-(fatty) acid ligase
VPSVGYLIEHPVPSKVPSIGARDQGGHILYSSGTTGTYKKLLIPDAMDEARNAMRVRNLGLHRETVFHALDFGLWTMAGFGNTGAVWHVGGCVVFDQRPGALRNIFRYRITMAFLIPTMISEILRSREPSAPRVDCELMTSGGFLPLATATQTLDRLTDRLRITYGSTECVGVLSSFFRTSDDLYWFAPYDERDVQVVDDRGAECPSGVEGDLRIGLRETDSMGYLDDDETSARFFRDGYFYPGDLAMRRDDGRIRILGRTGEVLNVGGLKLAVAPFEEAIQRHLGVEAVCLFSGLSDSGKEEVVIAIESRDALAKPALEGIVGLQALAPVIAAFKEIRYAILKSFPRTRTGMNKIRRADLRKLVFERVTGSTTA